MQTPYVWGSNLNLSNLFSNNLSDYAMSAAGLLSGIGGMMSGQQSASNALNAAGLARVQANQTDTAYREDLQRVLGNMRAIRASSGVGSNSPTGIALEQQQENLSDRNRITAVTGKRLEAENYEAQARAAQRAGEFALIGGGVKALTSILL